MRKNMIVVMAVCLLALVACAKSTFRVKNASDNSNIKEIKIGDVTLTETLAPGETSAEYEIKAGVYLPTYKYTLIGTNVWTSMTGTTVEFHSFIFSDKEVKEIDLKPVAISI